MQYSSPAIGVAIKFSHYLLISISLRRLDSSTKDIVTGEVLLVQLKPD